MRPNRHACAVGAAFLFALAAVMADAQPAQARLRLCNHMSYVIEAAIGLEDHRIAATRGWFRIDPGDCRFILQGEIEAEHLYAYARALPVYGAQPLLRTSQRELCVAQRDFVIANAQRCRNGQQPAPFTEVKPSDSDQGPTVNLAETADYDEEQARLAGIQRLLSMAGYDASPVDGVKGPKTDAALDLFLRDHNLAPAEQAASNFFDLLIDAVQSPSGHGFAWCNDTAYPAMAAVGVENEGHIVTRGWYRVAPGKCLRPQLDGKPRRVYSYAEAVDQHGQIIARNERPLRWGGDKMLCTRDMKFELRDHRDCRALGLTARGFALIDLGKDGAATVRLKQ